MGISYKLLLTLFILYITHENAEANGVSIISTDQYFPINSQYSNSFDYVSISRSDQKKKYFYKFSNISNFQ